MKVKLLKRIRKRFSIVPEGYELEPDLIYKHIIFDDITAQENTIFGNKVEHLLRHICYCLDTPFFKYSLWYNDKLVKRRNNTLRRKYFPFRKK